MSSKPTTLQIIDAKGKTKFSVANIENSCPKHWPDCLVQIDEDGFHGYTICINCGRIYEFEANGNLYKPTDKFISNTMYPRLRKIDKQKDRNRGGTFATKIGV